MSSPERTAGMIAAARGRHDTARRQAVEAIRRLDGAGVPVNIATVARSARVSRSWLYRQADLRAMIERLRRAHPPATRSTTPVGERATITSLHEQLATLRARHAELQTENRQLREALARKLGSRRAEPPGDR